ncbi:MAG: TonB-dependent receptor [Calditrichia bacterium]
MGRITDGKNGDPLPYVNVYLENTALGAATDEDGFYMILNVPPGNYTVTASVIGYRTMSFRDVEVSIDLTTRIDFDLNETALDLGETIVVEARKPIITKDLTASTAVVSSEDIKALPVTEFREILELQAGFISGHVRGGRTGEIVYAIDGVPITDAFDGSTVIDVNANAIQEFQFISGAFNAEYGKALSGYVNIATKEPDNHFNASLSGYMGDHVSTHTDVFRAIDQVDPSSIRNFEGFVSGPIVPNKLSFYINSRYTHFGGWINGRRVFNPWDITINNGPNVPVEYRYQIGRTGDGAFVPMNGNDRIYLQGKLVFKPVSTLKFSYNFLADLMQYREYDHNYAYNPDGDFKRFSNGYTHIFTINHVLNASNYYQLSASYFSNEYKHYVYQNLADSRYTHYKLTNQQPQETPSFLTGGTKPQHLNRTTDTWTAKFDYTSQITKIHQVKLGLDFSRYRLDYRNLTLIQEAGLQDPSISGNPFVKVHIPNPDDLYEYTSIDLYTRKPAEFSFYLQDKIELSQMIINAGLRFDSFFPDGQILNDPSDPDIHRPRRPENLARTLAERRTYWYKDATAKYQFSPRLGVSFPISDRGVFHFSYGHFFQIPNFELLYQNPEYKFGVGTGNLGVAGNPDLNPEQTINGEVGVSQALTSDISVDITGYFRDIRNLAGTRADEIDLFGGSGTYSQLVNSDFGFVRGVVLTVEKRLSGNWSAKLDYTLQTAKGNASDPAATRNHRISGEEPEVQLIKLDFDQTHTVNATFSYVSKDDWGFSIIGRYGSGMPYTPRQSINISKLLTNSEIRPANINVDLKAQKDFLFGRQRIMIFARILNLFDFKNQLQVYDDSGSADFTIDEYTFQHQNVPVLVNSLDEFYRNPLFYSEPRRIEVGMSFYLNP